MAAPTVLSAVAQELPVLPSLPVAASTYQSRSSIATVTSVCERMLVSVSVALVAAAMTTPLVDHDATARL